MLAVAFVIPCVLHGFSTRAPTLSLLAITIMDATLMSVEVSTAFKGLEDGFENSMKDYYRTQIGRLNKLITLLLGSLTKGER